MYGTQVKIKVVKNRHPAHELNSPNTNRISKAPLVVSILFSPGRGSGEMDRHILVHVSTLQLRLGSIPCATIGTVDESLEVAEVM